MEELFPVIEIERLFLAIIYLTNPYISKQMSVTIPLVCTLSVRMGLLQVYGPVCLVWLWLPRGWGLSKLSVLFYRPYSTLLRAGTCYIPFVVLPLVSSSVSLPISFTRSGAIVPVSYVVVNYACKIRMLYSSI